jgi:hypothetical protein
MYGALPPCSFRAGDNWTGSAESSSCDTQDRFVRFEVFTVVTVENGIFWDVVPWRSCVNWHSSLKHRFTQYLNDTTSQKTPFFRLFIFFYLGNMQGNEGAEEPYHSRMCPPLIPVCSTAWRARSSLRTKVLVHCSHSYGLAPSWTYLTCMMRRDRRLKALPQCSHV